MSCHSDPDYDPRVGEALKADLARLSRALAAPAGEQEKYAAGIIRLQQRIEQERIACGVTLERLCKWSDAAIHGLHRPQYNDGDVDMLYAILGRAAAGYEAGDRAAMDAALDDMDAYAEAIRGRTRS